MRIKTSIAAAALVAAGLAAAPDALAQRGRNNATPVVVLNYERLINESALGRDMTTKLQTLRQQITAEAQTLQPESQSLEQERQRLQQATRNLTADQIRNSTTWNPQFQALAQRVEALQRRTATLQGDHECSQIFAVREFDNAVRPIMQSVMQSRGASVVLDARNVQHAAPENDITTSVIQQLDQNQATRTANVTRHPVAECQPPQAAASQ